MLLKSKIFGQGNHVLIVLHGFLGMSDNWKSFAKKMNEKLFQVHLLDQRNHGESFHSNYFDYKTLADDLKFYINFHKIKICSVLGHSMGGKTAMMFSNVYPQFLKKLIIVDILPIFYKNDYLKILNSLKSLNLKKLKSRKDVDKALESKMKDPSFRSFLLKNLQRVSNQEFGFKIDLEIICNNLDEVEKELPSNLFFNGDVLFIKGEKSNYITEIEIEKTKKFFPNLKLVTIPDSGHWVHSENPEFFLKETFTFLKS